MSGTQKFRTHLAAFYMWKTLLKSYPHRHFFCVSVIHICLSYVEISSFPHSDSLFIFRCVYLHNIFLNILIIPIYNPLFCLLHTILYDF